MGPDVPHCIARIRLSDAPQSPARYSSSLPRMRGIFASAFGPGLFLPKTNNR